MALGSNGSRTAPQLGSVRDVFAFGAAGDGAVVVGLGDDTVATVRGCGGGVEGAAEPWQPASRPDAATSATAARDRRAAGLTASLPPASRR